MKLRNNYFLLRHGQTIYQTKKKNLVYPRPNKSKVNLTKRGESQVKIITKKLKNLKINLIFSSDYFRTRQTAKMVAKELELKVLFNKRLRDINLGVYQNRPKREFYRDFPNPKERFFRRPLQGESWLGCQKKMLNFLKFLDKKYKNKTILIISHGDPLWLLEGAVKNWSMEKLLKVKRGKEFIKAGELHRLF